MTIPNFDFLRRDLYADEGIRLKPYDDATGKPVPPGGKCKGFLSTGIGRNLDGNPLTAAEIAIVGHNGREKPISMNDANYLLANDIMKTYALLDRYAPWWRALDEVRSRVMVELCFNMGWGNGRNGLSSFKNTLRFFQVGEFGRAADNLLDSKWATQVGGRAVRLAKMLRSGADVPPTVIPMGSKK